MLSTLRSNSIMQGGIDFFCLACEVLLRSEKDVEVHVVLPTHVWCLQQTKYLETCIEDKVREVHKRYYCELCNILLPYKNKVNLHIKDDKHNSNKADGGVQKTPLTFLKWVNDTVVAFDDVLITDEAWHGFIDENTCIVCEKEFGEATEHKAETEHVIRLMQAKLEAENDSIYRTIDDTTFQCLTCNVVITSNEIVTHFDTAPHLKLYIERQKAQRSLEKSIVAAKNDSNKSPVIESAVTDEQVFGNNKKTAKKDQEAPKEQAAPKKMKAAPKKEQVNPKKEQVAPKKEEVVPKKIEVAPKKAEVAPKKEELALKKEPAQKKETVTKKQSTPKKVQVPKKEVDINKALGISDYINTEADPTGNMVNCILCGWTIERKGVPVHIRGQHHQTLIKLQEEREEKLRRKKMAEEEEEAQEESEMEEESVETKDLREEKEETSIEPKDLQGKAKIVESVSLFQKNGVLIDMITEKVRCTKCSIALIYNYDIIQDHIINHEKIETTDTVKPKKEMMTESKKLDMIEVKKEVKETKKQDMIEVFKKEKKDPKTKEYEQAEEFAEFNELTYNRDNAKAFCRICELKVPSSLKSMQEHVTGNGHQTKKNGPEEKPDPEFITTAMEDFCKELTTIKNFYQHIVIINDSFCVDILSFAMVTKNGERLRCQVCEVGLTMNNVDDHVKTRRHERAMKDTPVLSGLRDEFVREVRPEVFHCGFCGLVLSGRPGLGQHLTSEQHKRTRMQAEWNLEEHLPEVQEHRMDEQRRMEFLLLMRLIRF